MAELGKTSKKVTKKAAKKTVAKKALKKGAPKMTVKTAIANKGNVPGVVAGGKLVKNSLYTIKAVSREGRTGWVLLNKRKKPVIQSNQTFGTAPKAFANAKLFLKTYLKTDVKVVSFV